jgi:PhnB protein
MKVGIYLTFDGNCKEAMTFYRGVFGGDFGMQTTYGGGPEDMKSASEGMEDLILHMDLPIGENMTLMACDFHPGMRKEGYSVGNNVEIVLMPKTKEEVDRIFAALSADGTVHSPLQDTFWGSYFGACKDKFGTKWMFDFPSTPPSMAETKDEGTQEELAAKKLKVDSEG